MRLVKAAVRNWLLSEAYEVVYRVTKYHVGDLEVTSFPAWNALHAMRSDGIRSIVHREVRKYGEKWQNMTN